MIEEEKLKILSIIESANTLARNYKASVKVLAEIKEGLEDMKKREGELDILHGCWLDGINKLFDQILAK